MRCGGNHTHVVDGRPCWCGWADTPGCGFSQLPMTGPAGTLACRGRGPWVFDGKGMEMSGHIKLWDAPLRLFHWLFAGAVIAAIVTGWVGGSLMPWHGRLGLLVLGLLVFRLIWGFVGSTYACWPRIFAATFGVKDYLQGNWREAGHNPLGAFSVLAMLLLVSFQVASGLMATDDIAFQGPLYALVSSETGSALSGLHRQAKWLLLVLIGMHIAAIIYYTLVMRRPLVRAMIADGRSASIRPSRMRGAARCPPRFWRSLWVRLASGACRRWGLAAARAGGGGAQPGLVSQPTAGVGWLRDQSARNLSWQDLQLPPTSPKAFLIAA